MKFSVQLFALPHQEYAPMARAADELGYSTLWLADHVVTPLEFARRYPYKASGDPGYRPETPISDVVSVLSYLAGITSRVRLASGVYILPLRNPFHVARSWGTLQQLSGGRAVLGVGAGWMAEEFDAVGMGFDDRGPRMDEMLDVLAKLWSGEVVEGHGPFHPFPPLVFGGAPEHPPPLVFGGLSRPALRRAAALGSGWFGPNVDLETTAAARYEIDRRRVAAGRGDEAFDHVVRLHGDLTIDNARRYEQAGFDHLVVSPFNRLGPDASLDEKLASLREAREVLDDLWEE